MTAGEWQLRMAELCRDCAQAEAGEEEGLLQVAHNLLAIAPHGNGGIDATLADHLPPRAAFQRLLGAGAHDSAALALMPEQGSFLLSRSGGGACIASVLLPGMDEELTSEGESPALALVSALAAALTQLASDGTRKAERGLDCAMMLDDDEWESDALGDIPLDLATDVAEWCRPAGISLH
ncbi:MAG TPA: hypothetical protein VN222_09785 [Novosphingobium sp.]|nr:hypothetical protein [Novosphingobium sp.]